MLKDFGYSTTMKLIANVIGGAIIGLITSFLVQIALVIIGYPIAETADDYSLSLYGGAVDAIVISFIVMWIKDSDEVIKMNFWAGLLMIFSIGCVGMIAAIFVWGPVYMLIDFLGLGDLFNYFAEDILGGFNMGGLAIGIILGLVNYNEPLID